MYAEQKNARNVLQGARNRASGQHFEEMIEAACRNYRLKELAEIDKTPEPFKVERHVGQGKFVGHYVKQAQPDFKGTERGGRSIVFEAKHTEQGKIEQSVVSDEQTRALTRHEKMGAKCFVLVSFDFRLFYRFPWDVWKNMRQHFGHKHITPEEADQYRIRYTNGVLDFLRQEDK